MKITLPNGEVGIAVKGGIEWSYPKNNSEMNEDDKRFFNVLESAPLVQKMTAQDILFLTELPAEMRWEATNIIEYITERDKYKDMGVKRPEWIADLATGFTERVTTQAIRESEQGDHTRLNMLELIFRLDS